jgi:TetR/AcrR family transcriptional repressor of nem operon
MPRDGTVTRKKIMDTAQQMVLDVGLSGTSIEKVIDKAGVTKGTFFYHFKAEQLARDPLQQLLIFVGLFIEMTEQLEEPFPGCLYASYCYQSGAISQDVMAQVEGMMHFWRKRLSEKIEQAIELYPAVIPVQTHQVADHVLTTFEGAFVLSKVMNEPKLASEQLIQCRNYLELLFKQPVK